jgi:hypothetical protein
MHHNQQMVDNCCVTATTMCKRLGMNRQQINVVVRTIETLDPQMSVLQDFLRDLSMLKTSQDVSDFITKLEG